MKGKGIRSGVNNKNGVPTDLMVCFPTRAHLSLMPKPICSPSRPTEAKNLRRRRPGRCPARGGSPLFKANPKNNVENDEPTSPKVTCSGQIKVRPRPGPAHWASVVVEMENLRKCKKFGIKKDAMQLLGFLRGLRFNLSCFGHFPGGVHCTSDEEDDDADHDDEEEDEEEEEVASRTIFSKWFEVLEENQVSNESKKERMIVEEEVDEESDAAPPPPNALLLMRCRSAPEKTWPVAEGQGAPMPAVDGRRQTIKEDSFQISTDVAKETWIVGNMDPLARSRSWRR